MTQLETENKQLLDRIGVAPRPRASDQCASRFEIGSILVWWGSGVEQVISTGVSSLVGLTSFLYASLPEPGPAGSFPPHGPLDVLVCPH